MVSSFVVVQGSVFSDFRVFPPSVMTTSAITVDVARLHFPPPHDRSIETKVRVNNTSSESLAIKVKSTNPRRYFVNPTRFIINPNQHHTLSFTMLPALEASTPAKADVFQLEARVVPPGKVGKLEEMWDALGAAVGLVNLPCDLHAHGADKSLASTPLPVSSTAVPADPKAAGGSSLGGIRKEIQMTALQIKEAQARHDAARKAADEVASASTIQEAQRDEFNAESRVGAATPSVRLSIVVFLMLSSYLGGLLLSRGWPVAPSAM